MNQARRRMIVRPSKTRLVFWAACLAVIGYLGYQLIQAPVATTGKTGSAATEGTGRGDGAALPVDGKGGAGAQAVRFGALSRTSHLVALSGLESSVYALATLADGGLEARIFDQASNLYEAFLKEKLDVATVPLRDAARLQEKLGRAAPRIVAGAARGDEMFLVRKSVPEISLENLEPVRIGLLEPPRLDLSRMLRLDSKSHPTVLLKEASDLARLLASKEIDLALVPEPQASMMAALSGSKVVNPATVPLGEMAGATVLVATPRLIAEQPALVDRLIQQHLLSALDIERDQDLAIQRALAILQRAKRDSPPQMVWQQAVTHIAFGAELPAAELEFLRGSLPADEQPAGEKFDDLLRPDLLEAARRQLEETLSDK